MGVNESDYSWNRNILQTAFDQAAWASLKQVAAEGSGRTFEDEDTVALVGRLPLVNGDWRGVERCGKRAVESVDAGGGRRSKELHVIG